MLGTAVRRQGISKSKVELDDISEVFKKLSESSNLPPLIGTSNMIIKTPVYNVESDKCDNSIIATIHTGIPVNSTWANIVRNPTLEQIILENKERSSLMTKPVTKKTMYNNG